MSEFKAIDLHIHTLCTVSDNHDLEFDIERLRKYVSTLELKAISITNHNVFDKEQFEEISKELSDDDVVIFPGIELNLAGAHMLMIAPRELLETFSRQCDEVRRRAVTQDFTLSLIEFDKIYGNSIDNYLLIPHYKKSPAMPLHTISEIKTKIIAGEVQNPKKFELMKKDDNESLCPVMFSDIRMGTLDNPELEPAPKITYVSIDDITIPNLKISLADKGRVALTKNGKDRFIIDGNLTSSSLGLNVILGKRSSGKTHLLESIAGIYGNDDTLYIKQFEVINQCTDVAFHRLVESQFMMIAEKYLSGIKSLTEAVLNTADEKDSCTEIDRYLLSLKRYAENTAVMDVYANTRLFNENEFADIDDAVGEKLLTDLKYIIDNSDYSKTLSENKTILKQIYLDVLSEYRDKALSANLKEYANNIILSTKTSLATKSSSKPVDNPNLHNIARSFIINKKFDRLIAQLRKQSRIQRLETKYGRFNIKVSKGAFKNVTELQGYLGSKEPRHELFNDEYDKPHKFIKSLNNASNFTKPELIYRALLKIEVTPIKDDGGNISKGERAEYVLMKLLEEAKNYRLFLFDEPEPSFDNPFIGNEILKQLKELAKDTTVFVVTHNNTIGASMSPDCILYTEQSNDQYRTYVGSLTSKKLTSSDGRKIDMLDTIMSTLESSREFYNERKELYGNIEN